MVTKKEKTTAKSRVKAVVRKSAQRELPELAMTQMPAASAQKFISAVGRRKRAQARVRMTEAGKGLFTVNGRELKNYFPSPNLFETVLAPLKATGQDLNHDFSVKVVGGGWRGQAEAVRHGLARVLVKWNDDFRKTLKSTNFLTRDSREKERKKPGLKKARRAPQWAKR